MSAGPDLPLFDDADAPDDAGDDALVPDRAGHQPRALRREPANVAGSQRLRPGLPHARPVAPPSLRVRPQRVPQGGLLTASADGAPPDATLRLVDPLFRSCATSRVGRALGFRFADDALPGPYRVLLEDPDGRPLSSARVELCPGERRADRLTLAQSMTLRWVGPGRATDLTMALWLPPDIALRQRAGRLAPAAHAGSVRIDGDDNRWLQFGPLDVRGGDARRLGYRVVVSTRHLSAAPGALERPIEAPARLRRFLRSERGIEADDPLIAELAGPLPGASVREALASAVALVRRRVGYQAQSGRRASDGERGARGGLSRGVGDCTEQSALLVALLRAKGIPARLAIGAFAGTRALHAIAELWCGGLWLPVDPTHVEEPARPRVGMPSTWVTLMRGNWLADDGAEQALLDYRRTQGHDGLRCDEGFALTRMPRRTAPPLPARRRYVRVAWDGARAVLVNHGPHPVAGALYLAWDRAAPRLLRLIPVALAPGERRALPLAATEALPGEADALHAGFAPA